MKKKGICIFLLSILYLNGFAEEQYKSILNNGMARWSILFEVADGFGSYDLIVNENDTLINELSYKKIYVEYLADPFDNNKEWQNHIPQEYWELSCYVRESEDASKLYLWDADKEKETLIFDLDLTLGEKFTLSEFYGSEEITVDSIYIKDELKYVQLNYDCRTFMNTEKLTFIEGVGPNTGITNLWNEYTLVNCFQNDLLFYKNDDYSEYQCGWQMKGNKLEETDYKNWNVKIEENTMIISLDINQNIQIVISNIHGQQHFKKEFSNLQYLSIPLTNFSNGIYLLTVFDNNTGKLYTKKIIL